jgi:hypothetical protein
LSTLGSFNARVKPSFEKPGFAVAILDLDGESTIHHSRTLWCDREVILRRAIIMNGFFFAKAADQLLSKSALSRQFGVNLA